MEFSRLLSNALTPRSAVRRAFPQAVLNRIEAHIRDSEKTHSGQICFAVETALPALRALAGLSSRARAVELFSLLRVWDTDQNCGVLIYLLFSERKIEIIADRGIDKTAPDNHWSDVAATLSDEFKKGAFEDGVKQAISAVTLLLQSCFPPQPGGRNELPDRAILL